MYLQEVMKKCDAVLVALGLRQLEQRADPEPLGVARVAPLEVDQRFNNKIMQALSKRSAKSKIYMRMFLRN